MTCDRIREQLTAYLDGDLSGDRGTVVRGHLRGCDACRQIAADESALRDGLRALPPLDPPATLWAGVQARLAQVEVAEAQRPAWRRALARWAPTLPRFAAGSLVAAAAVAVLWWRTHRDVPEVRAPIVHDNPPTKILPQPEQHPAPKPECQLAAGTGDANAELLTDGARLTACYAKAAEELVALAADESARWSAAERAGFDREVAALRERAGRAIPGKPRQRAYRAMITYIRSALTRDDVALASGGAP